MWEEIKKIMMLGKGGEIQVYFLWLFIYDNYDYELHILEETIEFQFNLQYSKMIMH